MLIDEFIKYVDMRDEMIREYFDGNAKDCFKSPEKKNLYLKLIRPIDKKIMVIANRIMKQEYHANTTTFIRVSDVYNSQELGEIYKDRKEELKDLSEERA